MAVFATHVVVLHGFEAVTFSPGDELPEWAEGLVGAHCLEPEPEVESNPEDADTEADGAAVQVGGPESDPASDADEEESEGEEPTAAPADVPDFTAPAPRRNSRTRK